MSDALFADCNRQFGSGFGVQRAAGVFRVSRFRSVCCRDGRALGQEVKQLDCAAPGGQRQAVFRLLSALKECGKVGDLEAGRKLHRDAVSARIDCNKLVGNALISMYGKCGRMSLAQEVFDRMVVKDVVTWNSLITGYARNGESLTALELFASMDCEPSSVTYLAALKACGKLAGTSESEKRPCLQKGISIHKQLKQRGFDSVIAVATTLVDMYSKCGSLQHARDVFNGMPSKNIVTWNALIMGYVENGESSVAMDLYASLDCVPDSVTFLAALKACGALASEKESQKQACLEKGIIIHRQIRERGLDSDTLVGNSLISMYSKCGSMEHARQVFNSITSKNVFVWSTLIQGYVDNRESSVAMDLFNSMDCRPDPFTYVAALKACGALASEKGDSDKQSCLEKGIAIHKQIKQRGFESDIVVANTLVGMYCKCGSLERARDVFDSMTSKNATSWSTLMLGYVDNGESLEALGLFTRIDCELNPVTYLAALKACGALAGAEVSDKQCYLEKTIGLHKQLKQHGFDSHAFVVSSLVDTYSKCGSMQHAREVFDGIVSNNAVSWNALILGYVENGEGSTAMELFESMDCEADALTYVAALKACGLLASEKNSDKDSCLEKGIAVHEQARRHGFDTHTTVANTLVSMYSKCGSMQHAREVFDRMVSKSVVTWTSLIMGYVENGESSVALEVFASMDCEPCPLAYTSALKACRIQCALVPGRQIHARICELGLENDPVLMNTLMDFYVKCGCMSRAEELFNNVQCPDVTLWNVLIAGYSYFGDFAQVFTLSKRMQQEGQKMDRITFNCILNACSHAGLVEEGRLYFESLLASGIRVDLEHYNCMIDMLGRANRLQEALDLVKAMPVEADSITWLTLLGACKKWKNPEVGKVAFDALVAMGGTDAAPYVLMSDVLGVRRDGENRMY